MKKFLIFIDSVYLSPNFLEGIFSLEDPSEVLTMSRRELEDIPGSYWQGIDRILNNRDDENYWKELEQKLKACSQVISVYDEDYPESLKYIKDPPKVLYIKGRPLDLSGPKIAIVGARKSTAYGQWAAEKFAKELARSGATIISGMAQGIDGRSHKAALSESAYTIGVLGCGVDIKFPKNHSRLFDQMYEQGTIISEYLPGIAPKPYFFPARNRIISGLSDAVVVIEAKDRSGSLITARLGAEQGKDVYALPGNIDSLYSVGTNKLIRDGAIPLIEVEDIIDFVPGFGSEKKEEPTPSLSDSEIQILDLIKNGENTIDQLSNSLNQDIGVISSTITLMEMKGIISVGSGEIFIL